MTPEEDRAVTHPEPLLPEIERALMVAAMRRADGRSAGRRASGGRLLRRAGLLSAGALVVGGTAFAATAPWSPRLGDDHRGHPTVARTPVPTDQRDALAVLRRPQTAADRGPRVEAVLRLLSPGDLDGLHLDGVRLLEGRRDGASVLVPVQRSGSHEPGYPSSVRRNVLCLFVATDARTVDGRRAVPSVGERCGTAADVRAGRMVSGAQWAGRLGLAGLVPDGVARVEVPLRTGRTLAAEVRSNAFLIDVAVPDGSFNRNAVRLLDARGRVLRLR